MPIDTRGLVRVGARPGFIDYLVQLWERRDFIGYDAKAKVQAGSRKDRLGSFWLILNPVLNGLTYFLIFGLLLQTSRGIENFIGYLVIGVFLYQISARSISNGARSLQSNQSIIRAFTFPRAALPIAANAREVLAAVPVVITMLVVILLLPPTEEITWLWALLLPALGLQFLMNLGLSLILARIVSQVNDVAHLLSFGLRLWMYGSAVFFSYDRFIGNDVLLALVKLNPLFNVLDIARNCLLYAQLPAWQSWAILAAWSLTFLAIGIAYFWQGEESYSAE
ncbi:ABC transporter permease [Arthrobacter parietis]|uniref:Transport permease protein n=1 Tax=Arthrobacter parietis TaxID=271434 RepID=A0ABP5MWS2_9MICC